MARFLIKDSKSGDVFVTDEKRMSDALSYHEYQYPDGTINQEIELYDFELSDDMSDVIEYPAGYDFLARQDTASSAVAILW